MNDDSRGDTDMEVTVTQVREQCAKLVPEVLRERRTGLIENLAPFIEEVAEEVRRRCEARPQPVTDTLIRAATINRYCHVCYNACQQNGTLRQRQAFAELRGYLSGMLFTQFKRPSTVVAEVVEDALSQVWQSLHQVRDPGAFLRWASRIAIQTLIRRGREEERVSELEGENESNQPLPSEQQPVLGARGGQGRAALLDERYGAWYTSLTAAIEACLHNPVMRRIIIGLFLDHLSVKEIADQLKRTPKTIRTYKERALIKLRECDGLLRLLEDYVDGLEPG